MGHGQVDSEDGANLGIVGSAATSQREKLPGKLKPLKPIKTPKVDSLTLTDRASFEKEGKDSRMTERGAEDGVDVDNVDLPVVPERNTATAPE